MSALDDLTRWVREIGAEAGRMDSPAMPMWIKEAVSERLAALDMVPRAEFEAQAKVLARQAERIAELEKQLADLETLLKQ